MTLVTTWLAGLRAALPTEDCKKLARIQGASKPQLAALRAAFPSCPASLLELLEHIDGTYTGKNRVLILGSDVGEGTYPYYLLSAKEMLDEKGGLHAESIASIYGRTARERNQWVKVSRRIDVALPMDRRLCFAHCMNNGGSSMLYLDFNPAPDGKTGQVMRFLHDPDSYAVIADSFDDYLQRLLDGGFAFVEP